MVERAVDSPVSVALPALLRLARPASAMNLDALRARAPLHGGGLSALRGRGMEYDESRPYQQGDDPRSIDWRVTARSGRTHTKLFREERERPVLLWVDLRPSMFFATSGSYKAVLAARAAALLAWATAQQGDRVGVQLFAGDTHVERRPGRGRHGVLALCSALMSVPALAEGGARPGTSAAPDIQSMLARLGRVVRPGTRVFAISDFHDLDDAAARHLGELTRHAELLTVLLHDRIESELPPPGRYRVMGPAGEIMLDTGAATLNEAQRDRFAQRCARLERLARLPGGHRLACRTDEDIVAVLQRRFARRGAGRT